ncbi:helix-turn-helix domain-containing protein [Microbacterium halotolerans]|uniref:helix-turn-helix domain-containing protein n=1 Tax=Microbacterium halotolerans TaxID=246613 RepID=UPI000E6AD436|nr:XRE family transcriptional regulator [Microbacterium halotolerans]
MADDLDGIIDAIGPRLRGIRRSRGWTLAEVAERSGLSLSLLSRLETGRRRATLDALLPLARVYSVALDRLVGAPATGDPRAHLQPHRIGGSGVIVPLTRRPSRVQIFKHVLGPRKPLMKTHEGHAWLYVLAGDLRLLLGDDDIRLGPGESAEFDAATPHWFGPADDLAVEILHFFGPHGDRIAPPVAVS